MSFYLNVLFCTTLALLSAYALITHCWWKNTVAQMNLPNTERERKHRQLFTTIIRYKGKLPFSWHANSFSLCMQICDTAERFLMSHWPSVSDFDKHTNCDSAKKTCILYLHPFHAHTSRQTSCFSDILHLLTFLAMSKLILPCDKYHRPGMFGSCPGSSCGSVQSLLWPEPTWTWSLSVCL